MSKSLASFFGDEEAEEKSEMKKVKGECKMTSLLFKAMNDAHISHLLQQDKTLARHNAFGDFYTAVDGMLDTFTETYMGLYPITSIVTEGSSVITEPISYFTDLYAKVTEIREGITEGYLLNQVDEIHQLIAHTLYKFKNIIT